MAASRPLVVFEGKGSYFEIYFALGVKSCWLVDPTTAVVSVYTTIDQNQTFSTGEVVDSTLDLRLPLAEIFE